MPEVWEYGFDRLQEALRALGVEAERSGLTLRAGSWRVVAGLPGQGDAGRLLETAGVALPSEPEALCVRRLSGEGAGGSTLALYGADERGLLYALLDAARQVELADGTGGSGDLDREPLAAVAEADERPFLALRSVFKFYYQTDNDDAWLHSRDFWERYLGMLAASRFNAFTLLYGGDTPLVQYPFIVRVPGYEQVHVEGLPDAERERTLETLRFASELATQRGIDFGLAIWGHGLETDFRVPAGFDGEGDPARPAHYKYHAVSGLDERSLLPYCAAAIRTVLRELPHVKRLQLRLNNEAGLPKDELDTLWSTVFSGVAECGRPVQLDLRAKGITDHVIRAALEVDPTAFISTKYTTEHMGLPYHPARIQRREFPKQPTPPGQPPSGVPDGPRYGYGALLRQPLRYGFVYQLWSFGTQRLLTWGDPDYAARFARSATLGGGSGIEVGSLLGYQGHWHAPGTYRLLADPALDVMPWEEERYWYFYLLFGRLGYDPDASPEAWRRELRARFGEAAGAVEAAYAAASTVLPLVTTFRTPSAANRRYWPVMDPGGTMEEYAAAEPGDPGLFASIEEYVVEHLSGERSGRHAPWRVREWLLGLAEDAERALRDVERTSGAAATGELGAVALDVTIQALLARYHAARIAAGLDYAYARQTGSAAALERARTAFQEAVRSWEALVHVTDGKYHPQMRGFGGQNEHHLVQWAGGLPVVRAAAEELAAPLGSAIRPSPDLPDWERLSRDIPDLAVHHGPAATFTPGQDLGVRLTATAPGGVERVRLHYRYVNQREPYVVTEMAHGVEPGTWTATIPGAYLRPEWQVLYYFTLFDAEGRVTQHPGVLGLRGPQGQPGVVRGGKEGAPYYLVSACDVV